MQQILVYSDSLTWGIIPETRRRLPFDQRWPGVLENRLRKAKRDVRVIENCLNGRRTAWSDPFKEGRDGSLGLSQAIEMHAPLDLVILMLGTNDFQCTHDNDAALSALGMHKLITIIRQAPSEPGMPVPRIMVVAPPRISSPKGAMLTKFKGAEERSRGHVEALREVAETAETLFFDTNTVTSASRIDGIHLDADQHQLLGTALARQLSESGLF